MNFIQTADGAVNKAEALKDAIDNKDFSTAAQLTTSLSQDISGRALPEQINTAASLIASVQAGDISGSSALLRELTQGKHSHIIDVFDSVGSATDQVQSLQTAIESKNYGEAAVIASSLSQQVIGRDNKLSDTLSTLSDVLGGKVLVRMDSLPGGMTPGINPGASGVPKSSGLLGGFAAPVFQPMMANGLGGSAAFAQTTMAQACLLYTSPSPRDRTRSRMPSSA